MEFKYKTGPHGHDKISTLQMMLWLTAGLLAVYLFALIRYGLRGSEYLLNGILLMLVAQLTSFAVEIIYCLILKKDIKKHILSSFPWVTPLILTLMVPINTELYALCIATLIAVLFAKMVFGGFGQNLFNPAAVGRAVIFSSFAGSLSSKIVVSATPTGTIASSGWLLNNEGLAKFFEEFGGLANFFLGNYDGAMGETSVLLIVLIAALLIYKKVIDWYIPVTYIGVIFVGTLLVGLYHGVGIAYPLFCISTGAVMFGAVFMLTDPVTNPNTRAGKIVFACFAAVFTVLIRYLASLPEGVLYSILLANILTPAIDKYFDGKQDKMLKKITYSTIGALVLSVALIFCFGLGLKANSYNPDANSGSSTDSGSGSSTDSSSGSTGSGSSSGLSLNDDYSDFEARVINVEGNTYTVQAKGFGTKSGMGGYEDNVYEIVVEDGKVSSVKFITFGDTVGVGDAANSESFLSQFNGATIDSSIDATSGATITSKSVVSAVQAALGGPQVFGLSSDFSVYEAKNEGQEGNVYMISVNGYGVLPSEVGGNGNASGNYKRNVIAVVVEDNQIKEVRFADFGDTVGIGDSANSEKFLSQFVGATLDTPIDVVSGATYTSSSVVAAVQYVLEEIGG